MKPTLYLETTIVSYLVGQPTDNLIVAAHQELTRQWWREDRHGFRLYISQFVQDEAGDGDPVLARQRLATLRGVPKLMIDRRALELGRTLLATGLFPQGSARDASHISVAAVCGIDFLLTWNCKHLANARVFERVWKLCSAAGYRCPVICTPEELQEIEP